MNKELNKKNLQISNIIPEPENKGSQSKLNEKWGQDSIKAGWTAIPSIILERQQSLGLDAMDLAIILHLIKYWWEADRFPYPSKRKICEAIGIGESTMRKHIAKLQKKGLVKRIPKYIAGTKGISSNEYNLDGLVKKCKTLSKEELLVRKDNNNAASLRRRTKTNKKNKV